MESKLADHLKTELNRSCDWDEDLETIILRFPRTANMHEASLLDLGCGAEEGKPSLGEDNMPPILCEKAVNSGWKMVTGVDHRIDTGIPRRWTAVAQDLTDRIARKQLMPKNTYDCVVSNHLIGTTPIEVSPSLVLTSGVRPSTDYSDRADLVNDIDYLVFLSGFLYDIQSTLKIGGVFLLNRRIAFEKKQRGLKPIFGVPNEPISTYTLPY